MGYRVYRIDERDISQFSGGSYCEKTITMVQATNETFYERDDAKQWITSNEKGEEYHTILEIFR